jgi:hypothetical protein
MQQELKNAISVAKSCQSFRQQSLQENGREGLVNTDAQMYYAQLLDFPFLF